MLKRKRIMAAFLLVVVMLFSLPAEGALAAGGLFGESWFVEPDDLYFDTDGLSNINASFNASFNVSGNENVVFYWRNYTEDDLMKQFYEFVRSAYMCSKKELYNGLYFEATDLKSVPPLGDNLKSMLDPDITDVHSQSIEIPDEFAAPSYAKYISEFARIYYPLYCDALEVEKMLQNYNSITDPVKRTRAFKEFKDNYERMYTGLVSVKDGLRKSLKSNLNNFISDLSKRSDDLWLSTDAWAKKGISTEDMQTDSVMSAIIGGCLKSVFDECEAPDGDDNDELWGRTEISSFYLRMENYLAFVYPEESLNSSTHKKEISHVNKLGLTAGEFELKVEKSYEQFFKYFDSVYQQMDQLYQENISILENVQKEESPGLIERSLAEMIRGVGSDVSSLLAENSLTIENVVYGRVKAKNHTSGRVVNNFSFELADGNIYGVTGAVMYSILRGALFLGILLFFMYYLAKDAMTASVRARSKLKENVGYVFLAVALMFAMPNLIDLAIKIRDVILKLIGDTIVQNNISGINGLATTLKEIAKTSESLVDSLQYLGMVFISLYLGFVYIGMACSFTIMFAGFPLFLIVSFRDHKILNEWVTFCIGVIITPVIDAILFCIPIIATNVGGTSMPNFIKLLLCMSVMPARSSIKKILGFSSSIGSELLGVGAMMAAGRVVGNVTRTVKGTTVKMVEGAGATINDAKSARLNKELASLDTKRGAETAAKNERAGMALNRTENAFSADAADPGSPMYSALQGLRKDGGFDAETKSGGLGSVGGPAAGGGYASGGGPGFGNADPAVAKILSRNATMSNFEKIPGLDPKTKSRLYRNRAITGGIKTLLGAAGSGAGAIIGGTIGLGATSYMGTSAAAMGASSGMAIGSDAGGYVSSLAVSSVAQGAEFIKGTAVKMRDARAEAAAQSNVKGGVASAPVMDTGSGDTEYVPINQMFGENLSRDEMLTMASMSGEDADRLGYTDYINQRFDFVRNDTDAFNLIKEVGMFAGSMCDNNPNVGYQKGYLPPKSNSAIINQLQKKIEDLSRRPDLSDFSKAYNGISYVDAKGNPHLGSEGYYGAGFGSELADLDFYLDRMGHAHWGRGDSPQPAGMPEPTSSSPIRNSSGLDIKKPGNGDSDKARAAAELFAKRNGGAYIGSLLD